VNEDSAAGRVANGLRQRVVSGDLEPGTTLSQAAIAAEYGVSRIPVRDALQLLATDGLVDLQGTSAVVTPLSIEDLQELYDLREAVEPLATRLGAARVGRAEIARMTRLFEVMEQDTTTPAEWIEANAAFHSVVYSLAGRPRTISLVDHLRRLTDRYVYFHLDVVGQVAHLQDEHRQILAAVQEHDVRLAAELTRVHLVSSHDVVLGHLLGD
jgi:DNA-binding GntR family transcriptional regulator